MTKGKQQLIYDSYTISFLVGFLFAFLFTAPGMAVTGVTGTGTATSADTYAENFVDPDGKNIELSLSSTGWEGGGEHTYYTGELGIWVGPHVAVQPSGFDTPDGDTYFVSATSGGSSASKYAVTKAGESTISSAKRGSIVFTADFAANTNLGARFVAVVDGMWYASSQFGMADDDHGAMNRTEVTAWEVGVSANADTDNWYASLAGAPDGYVWRDGNQWDANPVAGGGLPVGDITQFGVAWLHTANHHYGAVDNFKWYDSSKINPPWEFNENVNFAVETDYKQVVLSSTINTSSILSECIEEDQGFGVFFQRHHNDHTICGIFQEPLYQQNLVEHGHKFGGIAGTICNTDYNFALDITYNQFVLDSALNEREVAAECLGRDVGYGVFYQRHTNGHTICGVYQEPLYQQTLVKHGHMFGGLCAPMIVSSSSGNTPPEFNLPATIEVTEGTSISFEVSVEDADGDHVTLSVASPPNGLVLVNGLMEWTPNYSQAGVYEIMLTADDGNGGIVTETITITVLNTNRPPVASAGTDITTECAGLTTAAQLDGSGSSDPDSDLLSFLWSTGATTAITSNAFALGETNASLTVTDPEGLSDEDEVLITIVDTTPPSISLTQAAAVLWPPNHTMVDAISGITATDVCGGAVDLNVTVTSNESTNGAGSGNTGIDWEVVEALDGTHSVSLRAERSGRGDGRLYSIEIVATDASGNSAEQTVTVAVPKNKGRKKTVAMATSLVQSHPNPFNAETQISFTLATESVVHLEIFDVMGRSVRTLIDHHYPSGAHRVSWDSRDDKGASVASGVYIYRLKTVDAVLTQRMMLLR